MSGNIDTSHYVETICELGCEQVRQVIGALENGQTTPHLPLLEPQQQQDVLVELKAIMAVYDRA